MTVRSALARINEILDQVLNEQEGDFDAAIAVRDRLVPPARLRDGNSASPTTSRAPATRAVETHGSRRDPHELPAGKVTLLSARGACLRTTTSSPTTASASGRCCTT